MWWKKNVGAGFVRLMFYQIELIVSYKSPILVSLLIDFSTWVLYNLVVNEKYKLRHTAGGKTNIVNTFSTVSTFDLLHTASFR